MSTPFSRHRLSIFKLILSLTVISLLSLSAFATQFAPSSRLSKGRWIKVRVDSSAIYQIDYETLRQWGFDNPEAVKIYGYSGVEHNSQLNTAPDDLPQVPAVHSADKIIFYGEGDVRLRIFKSGTRLKVEDGSYRNYYDTASYYFLTDDSADEPLQPATIPFERSSYTEDTHYHLDYRRVEEHNPASAGVFFFSRHLASPRSFTFEMSDYASDAMLGYTFAAHNDASATSIDITPGDNVSIDDSGVLRSTAARAADEYTIYNLSTAGWIPYTLVGTENPGPVTFSFSKPDNENVTYIGIYAVYNLYQRYNNLNDASQMAMHFLSYSGHRNLRFGNVPDDIEVWDVTDPRDVKSCSVSRGDGSPLASIPSGRNLTLRAFSPSRSLPTPILCGPVANSDLHGMNDVEYLVITRPAYRQQAERLASIHEKYQGLTTAVVMQEDILNEFSSGSKSVGGIRNFLRMLYTRHPSALKYVVFLGATHYDNRQITVRHLSDYLVGYEAEAVVRAKNSTASHSSDQYFAILAPETLETDIVRQNNPSDIAVGRLPVITAPEADALIDKIEDYFANPWMAGIYNRAVFIADQNNDNEHITKGTEADAAIMQSLAPGATAFKAYAELYRYNKIEQPNLWNALNTFLSQSPRYMNFSGHHDQGGIGNTVAIIKMAQLQQLAFSSYPIFFSASCTTQRMNLTNRGFNIDMLLLKDRGAIATIGSTCTVYMESNHIFNQAFTRALYSARPGDCLGDVYRRAHNEAITANTSVRINTFTFNLAGDPALPVYNPAYSIDITDGLADGNEIVPLTPLTLGGFVTTPDGLVASDFNGTMTITIFDSPVEKKTLAQNAGDKKDPPVVTVDETILASYTAEVRDGRWSATVTIPPVSRENLSNRMTLYAVSTDSPAMIAAGAATVSIGIVNGSAVADVTPPSIDEMYINTPDTADGAETGCDITLVATFSDDESGVAVSPSMIDSAPRLYFDNVELTHAVRLVPAGNGSYTMKHSLASLTDGRHSLRLRINDMAGNCAEKEVSFIVVSSDASAAVLTADRRLVRSEIELSLDHNLDNEPVTQLLIENIHGDIVDNIENPSFPYIWQPSSDLPDGTYRAWAILRSGMHYPSTPKVTFTLIKE